MRATLHPVAGGPPIPITRDLTIVGRQRNLCDVFIDQSSISKLHCLIVRTDGLLFIRDLASTNGTKVNGQKITRGALLPGDELAFGGHKFRVELGPGDPDVPASVKTEIIEPDRIPVEEEFHGGESEVLPDPDPIPIDDDFSDSKSDVRLILDDE